MQALQKVWVYIMMTYEEAAMLSRERTMFSPNYILKFDKEWSETVAKLKKSGYDLSKIKIKSRGLK